MIPYTGQTIFRLKHHRDMQEHFQFDVDWSEAAGPPSSPKGFAEEAIFVICNSGMKHTIARDIYDRVMASLERGERSGLVFGHKGKTDAIDEIWVNRGDLWSGYMALTDNDARLAYLVALPWIGEITKYHLAKNFGVDVAKPDVHLKRLADLHGLSAQGLCEMLAEHAPYSIRTIDLILWRACAIGVINPKTGEIRP